MESSAAESLILRLKRKWFDAIAAGYKKTEYRDATEYWKKRIEDKSHSTVILRNGYGNDKPTLHMELKGWDKTTIDGMTQYALHLGETLRMDNYVLPSGRPPPHQCGPVVGQDESQLAFSRSLGIWIPAVRHPTIEVEAGLLDEAGGASPSQEYTQEWDLPVHREG